MVVEADRRHAVLPGRDATCAAPVRFTLAHEIGHAALGDMSGGAIIDLANLAMAAEADDDATDRKPASVRAMEPTIAGSCRHAPRSLPGRPFSARLSAIAPAGDLSILVFFAVRKTSLRRGTADAGHDEGTRDLSGAVRG
jgi:hypothetical protein